MNNEHRKDKRSKRVWVKVQLKDDDLARHVGSIIDYWRERKSAAHHVTRAIMMYNALMQGDTTLLRQYFPIEIESLRMGTPPARNPATSATSAAMKPPKVERKAKTADEDKNDLLDLF